METVLVVNDNEYHLQKMVDTLETRLGYRVMAAHNNEGAMSKLICDNALKPDLVLIDMTRPDTDGLELLRSLRMCKPHLPVIMLVTHGDDKTMQQASILGASDILVKPFWAEQLRISFANVLTTQRMSHHISYLERKHSGRVDFSDLVSESAAMRDVLARARIASLETGALWISGESGTGKEFLASAIHGSSVRAGKPFVVVECSSLSGEDAEITLFGDNGKLAEAAAGTIVFKNAGMLKSALQKKLHDAIAHASRAGANAPRFILTGVTHVVSMDGGMKTLPSPAFQDVCTMAIVLPPLRERRQDIAALAQSCLRMCAASENRHVRRLTEDALEYLSQSPWYGNVRELMQLIWRAVLLSTHEVIEVGDIRMMQQLQPVHYENRKGALASRSNPLLLDAQGRMKNLEAIEKDAIQFALAYANGCMTHAAKSLGIGRSTLYRRMHSLKLGNYISRENQITRPTIRMSSKAHS